MAPPDAAHVALRECLDGSRTLLRELQRSNNSAAPEEMLAVQDLLECIDRNAEQIALALVTSRRRKTTDALGAVASLLREQDQYLQQVVDLYTKLGSRPLFPAQNGTSTT
ncbi:hypothetical protein PybrP1_003330 [[Pythium] brassicae (nom. inval.)]|nr:hypothetical protein PybrP1_003330 [[Pythium] brassicae (nom. inval.)]